MPTFGSLFSGIGGLDLGLERAGWECRWQVEFDEWCRSVLARHWPGVPKWGDAKTFPPDPAWERWGTWGTERELGVDLVCGGFPCQPVSLAGARRAQADDRWLWPEFARIVRVLRPRFVIVENVPGLLAGHGGMGDVLGDLAASGYDAEWDCIPAAAVGAPHLRYRVFVVAYARDGELRLQPAGQPWSGRQALAGHDGKARTLAHTEGKPGPLRTATSERPGRLAGGGNGSHALSNGLEGFFSGGPAAGPALGDGGWWTTEPNVGRVAHGVPSRVDRLRGLGNAVVPQVAEWIGERLMLAWKTRFTSERQA